MTCPSRRPQPLAWLARLAPAAVTVGLLGLVAATTGCQATLSPPFNQMKGAQMTVYRLQNYVPPATPQASRRLAGGLQLPPQIQQWISAGASLIPPGLLPPGLLPGTTPPRRRSPTRSASPGPAGLPHPRLPAGERPALASEILETLGHRSNYQPPTQSCMYAELGIAIAQAGQPPAGRLPRVALVRADPGLQRRVALPEHRAHRDEREKVRLDPAARLRRHGERRPGLRRARRATAVSGDERPPARLLRAQPAPRLALPPLLRAHRGRRGVGARRARGRRARDGRLRPAEPLVRRLLRARLPDQALPPAADPLRERPRPLGARADGARLAQRAARRARPTATRPTSSARSPSGGSAALFLKRPPAPARGRGARGKIEGDHLIRALFEVQRRSRRAASCSCRRCSSGRAAPGRAGPTLVDALFGLERVARAGANDRAVSRELPPRHAARRRAGRPGASSSRARSDGAGDDVLVRRLTYTLLRRLERERRAIVGPTKKPADRLREEVVRSPKLQKVIADMAGEGARRARGHHRARARACCARWRRRST